MTRHTTWTIVAILAVLAVGGMPSLGVAEGRHVSSARISQLTCEYAKDPLGVNAPRPRFSWVIEPGAATALDAGPRNLMQSAYRILVASSPEKLAANIGDKWDSGRVASDRSVLVPYEGPRLASGERCWWKVCGWCTCTVPFIGTESATPGGSRVVFSPPSRVGGPKPTWQLPPLEYPSPEVSRGALRIADAGTWSPSATFEMGLLEAGDWKGRWIGAPTACPLPCCGKSSRLPAG